MSNFYVVIPAAGIGKRMQSQMPKQYLPLDNGRTILDQVIKTFIEIDKIKGIVIAINPDDKMFQESSYYNHPNIISIVTGGSERINSVSNAIDQLKKHANDDDWIMVHDAVRPCIRKLDITNTIKDIEKNHHGGLLAIPIIDTVKRSYKGFTNNTIDRDSLWRAATPQIYQLKELQNALQRADKDNAIFTDESSMIENYGGNSKIFTCSESNIKVTTPDDIHLANYFLNKYES